MKIQQDKKWRIKIIALIVLFLIIGISVAGVVGYSLSLNSPAAFPVDI